MPPPPKNVSPGLLQRIKDRLLGTPGPSNPTPAQAVDQQNDQKLSPSLWKKIVDKVRQLRAPPEPKRQPEGPITPEIAQLRIQQAGRLRVLLLLKYNNTFRHVEPYEIKPNKTGEMRFWGFCRLHDEIHNFRMHRIQAIFVTDEQFDPRWPIKLF